jgi:hypothetical protein
LVILLHDIALLSVLSVRNPPPSPHVVFARFAAFNVLDYVLYECIIVAYIICTFVSVHLYSCYFHNGTVGCVREVRLNEMKCMDVF